LTLLSGQARITCLRDGGAECVEDARVRACASEALQLLIHLLRILFCELGDGAHFKEFEIAEHCRADGDEIVQCAVVGHRPSFVFRFRFAISKKATLLGWFLQAGKSPGLDGRLLHCDRCANVFCL
jgi:hypothetical protein